jgi:diguanylate cyclase (GGDEF)-like protein
MATSHEDDLVALNERYVLTQALIEATTALAEHCEPECILRKVCDALVGSTTHIRLAWMKLGELDASSLRPEYAVGPAQCLVSPAQPRRNAGLLPQGPLRQAIERWTPVVCSVGGEHSLETLHRRAQEYGLRAGLCLPIGRNDAAQRGMIGLYADHADYFSLVGLEVFAALADVINASLEQATLLQNLSHLATHDQLTQVLNRRGLDECMVRELSRSKRHDKPFGIILCDIDRFKLINDSLGHHQGDRVLKWVTGLIQGILRKEDCFGRWGGEEFLCLLPESDRDKVEAIAERMRTTIYSSPMDTDNGPVTVTASFGYACYPQDGRDLNRLITSADAGLYHAKSSGRNRTVGAQELRHHVYTLGSMLDAALRDHRIRPAYQPIVDLNTGAIIGEEALARLVLPDGDVIEAREFMEAASQLQLLHRIDSVVLLQAFQHCVAGVQKGGGGKKHFINISADLLRHRELVNTLLDTARIHCSPCAGLMTEAKPIIIEITERELASDVQAARKLLTPFTDFGLRLALDDFGSGFSSYRYLADLPISFLRIDGQLCSRLHEPKVRAIVQGIQDTADELGVITLAEFVEAPQTETILKEIGIHWGQGYLYGRPRFPEQVLDSVACLVDI